LQRALRRTFESIPSTRTTFSRDFAPRTKLTRKGATSARDLQRRIHALARIKRKDAYSDSVSILRQVGLLD
jgi:hypothetical protein